MWHLSGTSAISLADSTANGNTLTKVGSVTVAPAQIAGGASFPGYYGQHLIAPNNTGLAPAQLSVSCWFQTPVSSAWQYAIDSNGDSNGFTFQLAPNDGGYYVTLGNVYTNIYSSKTFGGGVHYFTATYDGSTVRTYIDGVPDVSQAISGSPAIQWPANGPSFGSAYSGAQAFGYSGGLMEEVRWSPAALAAGWVATEYNNQKSPGTFFTITAEQGPATGYPSITVTVDVASNAASPQLNQVSVSGGGSAGASANDSTIIVAPVAMPAFSPPGGMYTSALSVSVSATTSGATIRYTTNGSTPSETAGTVYNTPITVSSTQTINAIAYESGYPDSAISSATYTISPVLTISSTHTGSFAQGQTGTYTVTVSDQSGAGPTVGTVTLTETLPTGLTLASMAGANWTCTIATATCTALSPLQPGVSYPITATVNVASNAPSQVTNQVSVSGGGSAPGAGSDITTIVAPFTLSIAPQQQLVVPGGTASFTITAASSASGEQINLNWWNSTSGIIGFACQGYSGSFGITLPSTVTTGQQGVVATITMPVSSNFYNLQASPIFVCNFSVTGGYGGLSATQWGQVSVTTAPYYSFATPAPVTAAGSANFTLNVSSQNNFAGTVNFSGSVSSSCGITISPINPVVGLTSSGSGSTSMFVAIPPSCPAGNYPIAISSSSTSSPNSSPSQTAMLTLQTTPDFTVTISSPQSTPQGGSGSYQISVVPASGSSFNGSVSLSVGLITGGVSIGSLSPSASPTSAGTLVLNATNTAYLGTYPILVTATNASGTISHSTLAMLGVTLGSSPGPTVTLGTIRVGPAGLTVSSPLPPNSSDTITSCSGAAGITATLNQAAQTVALAASSSGRATCTTFHSLTIFFPIEPGPAAPLQVAALQESGGEFQFTISSSYLDEIDYVSVCNSSGCVFDGAVQGEETATFDANVPPSSAPCGPDIGIYNVVATGSSGDLDDNGPVYAYGSANLCYGDAAYTISGAVTASGTGSPVSGMALSLSGGSTPTATDANGNYSFTVADSGTYVVTPLSTYFTFSPAVFTAELTDDEPDQTVNFTAQVIIQMKLTLAQLVGSTVINSANNYSEDTTMQVTAVRADNGATITSFTGTVNIAEDPASGSYTPIYTQNGGYLPPSVGITTGGTATFLARSLAGPSVENTSASTGAPPNNAQISTTNYQVYAGNELTIPQWVTSSPPIDPLHSIGQVYDWLQKRALDIFNANPPGSGDVGNVLGVIGTTNGYGGNYTMDSTLGSQGSTSFTSITFNPNSTDFRLDSPGYLGCGFAPPKNFTSVLLHESRHAYQWTQHLLSGNDEDSDGLVNDIPAAPFNVILDTTTPRTVCNEHPVLPGVLSSLAYLGDAKPDPAGLVDYAIEMDAFAFSGSHLQGPPPPPALTVFSSHTGNFTQGQAGAAYTVTVSNMAGASNTDGTVVTVTEMLPAGLTLVGMAGDGWACSAGTCTRSDALGGASNYPAITVTVTVAAGAGSPLNNSVSVAGGGSAFGGSALVNTATDSTTIVP